MLNTENIKNRFDSYDELNILYETKLKNIEKNYKKIRNYFKLVISEPNLKLSTYYTLYIQIIKVIEYNNKFNSMPPNQYLYLDDKYRNYVNALINLIIIKEVEMEDIRLKLLIENRPSINEIHNTIKSFIGININKATILVNNVYPKLLTILVEEAKNCFKTSELCFK